MPVTASSTRGSYSAYSLTVIAFSLAMQASSLMRSGARSAYALYMMCHPFCVPADCWQIERGCGPRSHCEKSGSYLCALLAWAAFLGQRRLISKANHLLPAAAPGIRRANPELLSRVGLHRHQIGLVLVFALEGKFEPVTFYLLDPEPCEVLAEEVFLPDAITDLEVGELDFLLPVQP